MNKDRVNVTVRVHIPDTATDDGDIAVAAAANDRINAGQYSILDVEVLG